MTPTAHLHDLYYKHYRDAYPSVPAVCIPKPDYKLKETNGLTRAIIDFIRFSGGHAERVNTTGRQIKAKSGKQIWITTTATKGSADIHAVIKGRAAMIEVKNAATRDRIRPKQEQYAERVAMAGGLYFVARTFDEFHRWFTALVLVVLIGCEPSPQPLCYECWSADSTIHEYFIDTDEATMQHTIDWWASRCEPMILNCKIIEK